MRYAIVSDVHSNPLALERVLADAKKLKCDRFVMLGDITGYGYDVRGALDRVREKFDVALMGNHDSACLGLEPEWEVQMISNYDIDVAQRRQLGQSDKEWLEERPYLVVEKGCAFAHGNFINPKNWDYVDSSGGVLANFRSRKERLMFCGHTHIARAWELSPDEKARVKVKFKSPAVKPETKSFVPKRGCRYIVNVGSVGYPRHDLCSAYVVWDTTSDRVTFRRLPFDFKGYIMAMLERKVNIPDWLAELLLAAAGKS